MRSAELEAWLRAELANEGVEVDPLSFRAACWDVLKVSEGLGLDRLALVVNQDPDWPKRRGRTPAEQAAVRLYSSKRAGAARRVVWLVSPG